MNMLFADPDVENSDLNSSYMTLKEMLVSVKSASSRQQYLKLQLALELNSAQDANIVAKFLPRIVDEYHVFLRELLVEELEGSEGWYRLKEELLHRTNLILKPNAIKEVLIADMVIQ